MTNTKPTKHALLTSLMALLLCFTMLLGTTYAWFTDSVTSTGNKIQAGTLDVELYMHTSATDKVAISTLDTPIFGADSLVAQNNAADTLWEPGKTQVVYFSIKNEGNLALKYKVDLIVSGITNDLNEVITYKITPNAQFGSLSAWEGPGVAVNSGINTTEATGVELLPQAENFFALSVHMDEEAGNKYQNGSITFDMVVYASQLVSEEDSFNNQYDSPAPFLKSGFGNGSYDGANTLVQFSLYDRDSSDHNAQKVAYVKVPVAALADPSQPVSSTVIASPSVWNEVVVESDQGAQTFNISVSNLKEGNDVLVTYELRVGTGLTGVELYHFGNKIDAYYDGEYILFESTGFSPFTLVYDAEPKVEGDTDVEIDTVVPEATVEELEVPETFEWKNVGGFYPTAGENQKLDVVYSFKAPHTTESVANSSYKEWCCDYYVMLKTDAMETLPAGSITLGGNYGDIGWVGFDNPEVQTKTWIPLLGSAFGDCDETGAMVDPYWTYERVVALVEEFLCGVGLANGASDDIKKALSGAEFVVELRLTNPADYTEQIVANSVTYTFPTTVFSGEELQDAIDNGSSNIALGGDIDLSQGIVIPGN